MASPRYNAIPNHLTSSSPSLSSSLASMVPTNATSALSFPTRRCFYFLKFLFDDCALRLGFEMEAKDKLKNEDSAAESPTSVLEDEDVCSQKEEVKSEEEVTADVKDDGSSLISKSMVEEDEKSLEARMKEGEVQCEEAVDLNDTQFNKLDEFLIQTRLYSEFLLEKMDDITLVVGEQENGEEQESNPYAKKKGRGSKRKAAS